jgi:hypothetical protein
MPTQRTDNYSTERTRQPRSDLKLPLPQPRQTAHPLTVDGPEAVRDAHC